MGNPRSLRDTIREHGCGYVLAVKVNTQVWIQHAPGVTPAGSLRRVAEVVASWPESRWQRLEVAARGKGATGLRLGLSAGTGES